MNKENILLEALNTYGNFTTVSQEFSDNQLQVIYEAMELVKNCSTPVVVGQSELLKAFVNWRDGLSQEELVWYEGIYVEVFLSL